MSLLGDAVEELYAADLDRFIARRTELAKAARAADDKDAAAAITALRKPTQSAFTINRLARTDPDAIDTLVRVGTELLRAQTTGDGKALRELNSQRRKVLDRLTGRAFEIIGQQSPSAGQREEITATLTAALAEPGVAEQLRHGTLVRAAEPTGFGFSPPELTLIRGDGPGPPATPPAVLAAAPPVEPVDRAKQRADEAAQRATAARERRDRAAAAHDKAVREAAAASSAADDAVQTAVAQVTALQHEITRLQRDLTTARRALEQAQQQARTAEQRQKSARAALHKARG